ncbi:MAG: copper amine oxidase N-terminal domain-containing protein [Bacillota bacterium]|nr:copper amine oxidase N-terminal domain-containing protein [Bacillota bacterium]
MKKKAVVLLFTFIFTILMPLSALGSTSGKDLFLKNMQVQTEKQVKVTYDKPISGEITVDLTASGDMLTEVLGIKGGQADIIYDIDVNEEKAFIKVSASIEGTADKDFYLDCYIDGDTMIIPVDCLETLCQINPMEMPEEGIEYVYIKLEDFSFAELQAAVDQSKQQELGLEMVNTIFAAFPDKCFSTRGTTAIMNIDKLSLISFLKKFQDQEFVDSFAEQLTALNPEMYNKDEFAEGMLLPDDVSIITLFKDLHIHKCRTEIGLSRSLLDYDISFNNDETDVNVKIKSSSKIKSEATLSESAIDVCVTNSEVGSDQSVQVQLNSESYVSEDTMNCKGKLDVSTTIAGEIIKFNTNFKLEQSCVDKFSVEFPVLTEGNSIDAETLKPEVPDYEFENQITVNIDDDDYIWFDNAPFIEEDRILVPARELGFYLDYDVTWNPPANIVMTTEDHKISMNVGEKQYTINGTNKDMDSAFVIRDGVGYVPIRFVVEELGYEISYDAEYMEVYMSSQPIEE